MWNERVCLGHWVSEPAVFWRAAGMHHLSRLMWKFVLPSNRPSHPILGRKLDKMVVKAIWPWAFVLIACLFPRYFFPFSLQGNVLVLGDTGKFNKSLGGHNFIYSLQKAAPLREICEGNDLCLDAFFFRFSGARFDDGAGGDNEVQRTMLELINQLDGFDPRGNIKVLMATNRPDTLDPALMRPGRLDRKIEFSLPDLEVRNSSSFWH